LPPLQFANPVSQLPIAQAPLLQLPLALGKTSLQLVPQAPQFTGSVALFTSQPFGIGCSLSQFLNEPLQVIVQAPAMQPAVPLVLLQTFPQVPQLEAFVFELTSQPLEYRPSQSLNGLVQLATAQLPALHAAVPFVTEQVVPHAPQLLVVSTAVSQPVDALPSQLPKPAEHCVTWQLPVEHDSVALARLHAVAQAPQCASVLSACSQPFAAIPSQLSKPPEHAVIWQLPVAQDSVAFARLHVVPQAPQCAGVVRLCSHPSA
jgi:hypothetical protein